jgi:hypothetical protein
MKKRNTEELKDTLYLIADVIVITKNLRQAVETVAPDIVDTYDTVGDWAEAFIRAGVPEEFRRNMALLNEINIPYDLVSVLLKRVGSVMESQYKMKQAVEKEMFQPKLILFFALASIVPLFIYVLPYTADSMKYFVSMSYPFQGIISKMSPSLKMIITIIATILSVYVVFFTPLVNWLLDKTLRFIPAYKRAVRETQRGLFFSNLALYIQGTKQGVEAFLEEFYESKPLEKLEFLYPSDIKLFKEVLTTDVLLASVDALENFYRSAFAKAEKDYTVATQIFTVVFTMVIMALAGAVMIYYMTSTSSASLEILKKIGR